MEQTPIQAQSAPAEEKTGPRHVFLHLLAMSALYFSAGSFITLIFQYVSILFPDPLENTGYYDPSYRYTAIRFAISALIVIFPVYLFTTRYLNKLYRASAEIRTMRIRKWLTYLTLFVAAGIIIGDLVALVNGLLGGGLTARFVLKVITVLFVAGSIFYYYLWDLKRTKSE